MRTEAITFIVDLHLERSAGGTMPPIIREGWARSLQIAANGRISRARGTRSGLQQPPPGFSGICRDFPGSFRIAQHQAGRRPQAAVLDVSVGCGQGLRRHAIMPRLRTVCGG